MAMVRQDVEERAHQVEVLTSYIRDLEDGADALADELACRVDALLVVGNVGWQLARAGAAHDLVDLGDGLLQDVGWADIDLRDDDHDWHVEGEGDAEMLLTHTHKAVVGCDHK